MDFTPNRCYNNKSNNDATGILEYKEATSPIENSRTLYVVWLYQLSQLYAEGTAYAESSIDYIIIIIMYRYMQKFTLLKVFLPQKSRIRICYEDEWYLSFTAMAAALYHEAAAIAPGSGTVARISPDT